MPRWGGLVMLLVVVGLGVRGENCLGNYREAVEEQRSKFAACFNITNAKSLGRVVYSKEPYADECYDYCLGSGLNEIKIDKELRTPGDSVLVIYEKTDKMNNCVCVLDYPGRTDEQTCNDSLVLYDIPLYCAGVTSDDCGLMPNCEYSSQCCYYRGTVPEHPLWKASRIVLQWVFLSVAMVFVVQVILYSIFKVRGDRRGFRYGGDLAVGMLAATAEEYTELLESLPQAQIPPGDTGTACTICLEDLVTAHIEGSDREEVKVARCVALPTCGHVFHLTCIKSYAAHEAAKLRPALCPNCRAKILNGEEQDDEQAANRGDNRGGGGDSGEDGHAIELHDI